MGLIKSEQKFLGAVSFGAVFLWAMFLLIFITIVTNHFACPYVPSDKSSCNEPDRDAESCSQLTEAATFSNQKKMNFFARFSDRRNKFRHQLEVKDFWPDDMNGIPNAQQNAERATQKRQQRQRYMDYSPEDLKQKIHRQRPKNN